MFDSLKLGASFFLFLSLALVLGSCERGSGHGPVSWPELTHLDEIAYRAEGMARADDLDGLRALRAELLEAGWAVRPATLPKNHRNPQEVEQLLTDLNGLINEISQSDLDDETLSHLVIGLHPVISELMEAAGMPHVHSNEGPNHGFLYPLFDGDDKQVGTAEIKLHDDAGDLEIWLTRGGHEGEPWRLPLDTSLTLDFPALGNSLQLAVRDRETNADESGQSTIHDGKTAYFVFPGATEADASWLTGEEFAAKAELRFEDATTGQIVLRPHVHP